MSYVPKEIKEEVNVTKIHPLKFFAQVVGVVVLFGAILYGVTGIVADQIALHLDPKFEKSIGQTFSDSIPAPTSESAKATETYLQELVSKLHASDRSNRPPVKVHLWETKTVNAAALPGGEILVTTGLLNFVKTENELAFVLAHELGHHQYRHPIRRLGRSLLWTTVLSIVGFGNQNTVVLDQTVPGISGITDLHFSRAQELEADRYALNTVVKHYKHGGHALDFFERLPTLHQDGFPDTFNFEIVSTHPNPDNRIKKLKAIAQGEGWSLTGTSTPLSKPLSNLSETPSNQ